MIRIVWFAVVVGCHAAPALAQNPDWQPSRAATIKMENGASGQLVDLNADGHLDFLWRLREGNGLVEVYGTGRATVGPIAQVTRLSYAPGATLAADIDADGRVDIVIASKDDGGEYIQIKFGKGPGLSPQRWSERIKFSEASEFYKPLIAVADFNEDGKPDLMVGNGRQADLSILLGDGKGAFALAPKVHIGLMPGRYYAATGDVDADGHIDIVVAGNKGDDPAWLLVRRGDGKGGFTNGTELRLPASFGTRIEVGDINDDKYPDVLLSYESELGVYLNDRKGRFTRSPGSPGNVGREVFETHIADLNADGKADIVVATVDSVTVLLGNGTGFRPAKGSPFAAGPGAYFVEVGDLNEDGKPDIVSNSFGGNTLGLLLGG